MGVILLYDLDRRSTRNLGVLRNFDTGAALNADSTTRIQRSASLVPSRSGDFRAGVFGVLKMRTRTSPERLVQFDRRTPHT